MAAPRKPTALLEQTGAFKKNPDRRRDEEPQPAQAINYQPPAHLDEKEQAMWHEIVSITPPGVLGNSDSLVVEELAILYTRFRKDKSEMPPALISRMDIVIGRLGLSPSDRAKLTVEKPRGNKFSDI